jgi:hypothetical protein
MPIRVYLPADAAFSPEDIKTMSHALEDACNALKVNGDAKAREAVAIRIIELARRGERDAAKDSSASYRFRASAFGLTV